MLEEHYTEPFDLSSLARELHLSKHHVSHLFRSETGGSITEYVIDAFLLAGFEM
ncbi:AraC family transcriptional regulator [Paenibacillus sp. GD4]|uniref:AraC family transcriptional regulator n=1 Tax=Paenibacillus sp. GD4 TaxID=3068890 RepID=UPI00358E7AAD